MTQQPPDPDALAGMVTELLARLDIHAPEPRFKAAAMIGGGLAMLVATEGSEGLHGGARLFAGASNEAGRNIGLTTMATVIDLLAATIELAITQLGTIEGVRATNLAFGRLVEAAIDQAKATVQ